jgi:hypothetical protein
MTQAANADDLRTLYERAADGPVAVGDHIYGKRVIGFYANRIMVEKEQILEDRLLIDDQEPLTEAPDLALSCHGEPMGLARTGPSPVADLRASQLTAPDQYLRESFEQELVSRGEGGQFIRGLLDEISGLKHHTWLVGGAVRDLLVSGPGTQVSDLDMTGTIGPACLNSVRLRRSTGAGDYIPWLSPQNVWSLTPAGQRERLIEYKPLARSGFPFPVWGSSLAEDAATRDLTINALYYDPRLHVLADPSGEGLTHLYGKPQVAATPYRGSDPVEQAAIILRCIKFRLRWSDLDITEMGKWVRRLPNNVVTRIPETGWHQLVSFRRRCVSSHHRGRDELVVATELGPVARQLIEEIQARD